MQAMGQIRAKLEEADSAARTNTAEGGHSPLTTDGNLGTTGTARTWIQQAQRQSRSLSQKFAFLKQSPRLLCLMSKHHRNHDNGDHIYRRGIFAHIHCSLKTSAYMHKFKKKSLSQKGWSFAATHPPVKHFWAKYPWNLRYKLSIKNNYFCLCLEHLLNSNLNSHHCCESLPVTYRGSDLSLGRRERRLVRWSQCDLCRSSQPRNIAPTQYVGSYFCHLLPWPSEGPVCRELSI